MKSAHFGPQNNRGLLNNLILVIDKTGAIGWPLSCGLAKTNLVVFVGDKLGSKDNENVISVPFSRRFPKIPDGRYSCIIFVNEGERDLELLPSMIKKVRAGNSRFVFIQSIYKNAKNLNRVLKLDPTAKIVLVGDVFGGEFISGKKNLDSTMNRHIYQAQQFGKIQILGDGLGETFPVFLDDIIGGLKDVILKPGGDETLFYFFPKYPISELSLAHMIQRKNPEIFVDFVKGKLERPKIISGGRYVFGEKYFLDKKIRKIDIHKTKIDEDKISKKTKKFNMFFKILFWSIAVLFFLPGVFTLIFSFLGNNILNYANNELTMGDLRNAKSAFHLASDAFYFEKQSSEIFLYQTKFIKIDKFNKVSEGAGKNFRFAKSILNAFDGFDYLGRVISGDSQNPNEDLIKTSNSFKSSISELGKLMAEGDSLEDFGKEFERIGSSIKLFSVTSDILPSLLGIEKEKKYLILFQDNYELRPGGGKIETYGILTFNLGKIKNFYVDKISNADKKLRGHLEPPFAIRRHMQLRHWYAADSNFNVDYVKASSDSANFLYIETGQRVDGVISVDMSFVKKILKIGGAISINGYKENIDESNFDDLYQKSSNRSDLLLKITTEISNRIMAGKINFLQLLETVSSALDQKHLLFMSNDFQKIFTANKWSSSLWSEDGEVANSVNDFLGISEANLGENRINNLISREIFQVVNIYEDGSISGEIKINFINRNKTTTNADYKNFLRMILPKGANLVGISINNRPQEIIDAIVDPKTYEANNFKLPQGLEVEKTIEENKNIYGFYINVLGNAKTEIKINYLLSENVLNQKSLVYHLRFFKQPGVDSIPFSFELRPGPYEVISGRKIIAENLVEDKNFSVNLSKE